MERYTIRLTELAELSQLTPSRLHEWERVVAGDELCAAFTCHVVPGPLERDQNFVLKADQVVQVDEEPQGRCLTFSPYLPGMGIQPLVK